MEHDELFVFVLYNVPSEKKSIKVQTSWDFRGLDLLAQ